MFCPFCGCSVSEDSLFCPKCDAPIGNAEGGVFLEEDSIEQTVPTENEIFTRPITLKDFFTPIVDFALQAIAFLTPPIGVIIALMLSQISVGENPALFSGKLLRLASYGFLVFLVFAIIAIIISIITMIYAFS